MMKGIPKTGNITIKGMLCFGGRFPLIGPNKIKGGFLFDLVIDEFNIVKSNAKPTNSCKQFNYGIVHF
jgi:hypothetical protein